MMSHFLRLRRILRFGPIMGYLIASAFGSFAFTGGFKLIAKDGEELDVESPSLVVGRSPKLWVGMDAALFLMAFITSEALMTILALHR